MKSVPVPAPQRTRRASVRSHLLLGVLVVLVLVGGIGGMAWSTVLAGAVIASGSLVVDSNVKQVQHLDGGIVGEIAVDEGDVVKAGQVLVRLDPTVTKANLAIITKGMDQHNARLARLEAERDGTLDVNFPEHMQTQESIDLELAEVMRGERVLFTARAEARQGRVSQFRERTTQLREEIGGLDAQVAAKAQEITLISEELKGTRALWAKQLMPIQRVTAIEREAAQLEGERGALVAQIARARAGIAETELQILQINQDTKSDVATELRDAQSKLSELAERRIAAEETLRRLDIRSPQAGVVHELAVHTIGGVIASGAVLMQIVPLQDRLRIDAKVAPDQVDQLYPGQAAVVHFSAFDRGTTPELNAELSLISPDLTHDERSGLSYYVIHLRLRDEEIARLGNLKLVPGMPIEAFIQTSSRTMLSYLTKPLSDQLNRSFRE